MSGEKQYTVKCVRITCPERRTGPRAELAGWACSPDHKPVPKAPKVIEKRYTALQAARLLRKAMERDGVPVSKATQWLDEKIEVLSSK